MKPSIWDELTTEVFIVGLIVCLLFIGLLLHYSDLG